MSTLTIEQRLARLESSNRRYRFALLFAVLIIGGGVVMGFDKNTKVQKLIRAEKIEIVNSKGDAVIELDVTESGTGKTFWRNQDGDLCAVVGALPKGGLMQVTGTHGLRSEISMLTQDDIAGFSMSLLESAADDAERKTLLGMNIVGSAGRRGPQILLDSYYGKDQYILSHDTKSGFSSIIMSNDSPRWAAP